MNKLAPHHRLPRVPIVDRDAFIRERCSGKRTFHIGCANWPFTEALLDARKLLHVDLEPICSRLAGVDIEEEAIELMQRRGVDNVFAADSSTFDRIVEQLGWTPEIVLVGEVLEHVEAPGMLLKDCARCMTAETALLITVPNALSLKGVLHVMLGHEKVHHDHVAYYSYANLCQLASRCNLWISEALTYRSSSTSRIERGLDGILSPILRMRPFLCDGLIFSCRLERRSRERGADSNP